MIARHVETIFCDDIRQEIGGKLSYIGVYPGGLFVRAFPSTLPKLCLSVRIITPANEPLKALTLQVLKNEETLQELVLDDAELAAASHTDGGMDDGQMDRQLLIAQFMLVFSPVQFDGPCDLRVRVQTEAEELHGVALKVDQVPQAFLSDTA